MAPEAGRFLEMQPLFHSFPKIRSSNETLRPNAGPAQLILLLQGEKLHRVGWLLSAARTLELHALQVVWCGVVWRAWFGAAQKSLGTPCRRRNAGRLVRFLEVASSARKAGRSHRWHYRVDNALDDDGWGLMATNSVPRSYADTIGRGPPSWTR